MANPTKPQPPKAEPATVSTYKSFSIVRRTGGWVMLTTTIAVDAAGNSRVLGTTSTEPNLKAIAIEDLKKANYHWWTSL